MLKFQGKVTDTSGNPVPGAQLTITKTNVITPLPVIYSIASDGSIVASANPFNSDSNGEYVFAVEPGSYSIEATGSSAVLNISKTITQFTPSDPASTAPVAVTLNRLVFYSLSSWTAPPGVIQATVTCVGGGGGGGGGSSNGGGDTGGGAGGSGAATIRRTLPVDPGTIYPITIGTAGSGNSAGVAGLAGGNTTFGSLVQANGGNGGGSSTTSAAGVASTAGNGTMAGFGGGITTTFTTTAMPILYGFGAAISGSTGGNGGNGFTGDHGVAGNSLETFAGGARGLGNLGNKAGGGGGGSSAFGRGGTGGNYGGAAATSPAANNWGAGGGGGAALGSGASGSDGLCIVEWIS